MIFAKLVVLAMLAIVAIYLFVTAPEPLPDNAGPSGSADRRVAIAQVFEAANAINHEARRTYTARVVGPGQQAGLEFAEDWREKQRQAGPLPALFLRLVSSELTKKPQPLGLFLGSDEPINPSNLFTGEQKVRFGRMQAETRPQVFATPDGYQVAMYPDVASAEPCVRCHNEHKASPKRDWKLDDIMGATTWIYPQRDVSLAEFLVIVANVYSSVEAAWETVLAKAATFTPPPAIGPHWPKAGARVLPDSQTFMAEVYQASAPTVVRILSRNALSPQEVGP
ncbi:MAG: DUF3365 domain-containing protein [Hyphomonadaceae bacterium]|jgi:hypothetical protein|nr:DUF3365 domain-containing protein [Hyphomonadaceae bacterium]